MPLRNVLNTCSKGAVSKIVNPRVVGQGDVAKPTVNGLGVYDPLVETVAQRVDIFEFSARVLIAFVLDPRLG